MALEVEDPPRRITTRDPGLAVLNQIADVLEPFDRAQQLRIMCAACVMLGQLAEARLFLSMLEREARSRKEEFSDR